MTDRTAEIEARLVRYAMAEAARASAWKGSARDPDFIDAELDARIEGSRLAKDAPGDLAYLLAENKRLRTTIRKQGRACEMQAAVMLDPQRSGEIPEGARVRIAEVFADKADQMRAALNAEPTP